MTLELYKLHRPKTFEEVIGQDAAIRSLIDMGRRGALPHCILFTGSSGVGKTTIARILAAKLRCGEADYREINAADFRGIEMVRQIRAVVKLAPMQGKARAWTIDELHQLTSEAQNAFLKILEDTPRHVWFFLCTTEPERLKRTIVTRSHVVALEPLSDKDLEKIVVRVAKVEKKPLSEEVVERLISASDGSARKALVLLHSIIGLEDRDEQLEAISKGDVKGRSRTIVKLLLERGTSMRQMNAALKEMQEEPESVRRQILGYCEKVMVGGGRMANRAAAIVNRFQDNLYDSGKAGLVLMCWDVMMGEKDG